MNDDPTKKNITVSNLWYTSKIVVRIYIEIKDIQNVKLSINIRHKFRPLLYLIQYWKLIDISDA